MVQKFGSEGLIARSGRIWGQFKIQKNSRAHGHNTGYQTRDTDCMSKMQPEKPFVRFVEITQTS